MTPLPTTPGGWATEIAEVLEGKRRWCVALGDNRPTLAEMAENSIDACVSDPPYELTAAKRTVPAPFVEGSPYSRHRVGVNGDNRPVGGFMGKEWDGTGIAFSVEFWASVLRVLKPGAHLLAFGGTRTYHRMACAIEDAGFEIRDSLHWMYGTGFPKSLDVSKALAAGASQASVPGFYEANAQAEQWAGRGTALKPAHEPIVLARKPLIGTVAANVLEHGTGALNIDGCRIGTETRYNPPVPGNWTDSGFQSRAETGEVVTGRWPANVLFDEFAAAELDRQSGELGLSSGGRASQVGMHRFRGEAKPLSGLPPPGYGDSGGASRFFYVSKPSREERDFGCDALPERSAGEATDREDGSDGLNNPRAGAGRTGGARNFHPTVKPIDLMAYLCRLVTPPGGVVLDPFTGSGSTGCGAIRQGLRFIGCEMTPEYVEIANARIGATERVKHEPEKVADASALPGQLGLFGGAA